MGGAPPWLSGRVLSAFVTRELRVFRLAIWLTRKTLPDAFLNSEDQVIYAYEDSFSNRSPRQTRYECLHRLH